MNSHLETSMLPSLGGYQPLGYNPIAYPSARLNDVNEMSSRFPPAEMNQMNSKRQLFSPDASSHISLDSDDTRSQSSFQNEPGSVGTAGEPGLINKKRGRRPLAESSQTTDRESPMQSTSSEQDSKLYRMKQAAKEQLKVEDESQLARFGNKYVIKGSEEYYYLKKKNNEAVKRCRRNNAINQRHIEKKIKDLDDENKKLEIEVNSLEVCVKKLKDNIVNNKNYYRLPERIQHILHSI